MLGARGRSGGVACHFLFVNWEWEESQESGANGVEMLGRGQGQGHTLDGLECPQKRGGGGFTLIIAGLNLKGKGELSSSWCRVAVSCKCTGRTLQSVVFCILSGCKLLVEWSLVESQQCVPAVCIILGSPD